MSTSFPLDVLRIMAEYDSYYSIFWRCDGEFAPITFFVNCNDLFWWGTADAERLLPEDLPDLRKCLLEVSSLDPHSIYLGYSLWCARKRKMRPQLDSYPKNDRLRALFDACGPFRENEE